LSSSSMTYLSTTLFRSIEQLQKKLKEFTFVDELLAKKAELEAALAQKLAQLKEDVKEPEVNDDIIVEMDEAIESRHQVIEKEAFKVEKTVVEEKQAVKEVETVKVATDKAYTAENIITTIDQVTNELLDVDGFNTIVRDLKEKKHRLENRQLTIALFGAFSAGKSSFSNALFGEQVLPVSPNPTTAVISRINPITDNYKHGTVVIQLKDDATLTEDLKAIT